MDRTKWGWVLALLGMILLVRVRSFTETLEDGNVGLYFHIATGWIHGQLPYIASWEYKPPGLFALLALGLVIFQTPTLACAALSVLAVFATSLVLYRIGRSLGVPFAREIGLIAAAGYAMLSIENDGLSGDAQLYVAPFLSGALAIVAFGEWDCERRPLLRTLLGGLLAGFALQMKLTALTIVVPLGIFAALLSQRRRLSNAFAFMAAALLPFGIEAAMYAHAGALGVFSDANAGATLRRFLGRAAIHSPVDADAWLTQLRSAGPFLELAPLSVLVLRSPRVAIVWAWLVLQIGTLLLVGEYYQRNFYDLLAPLSLLGAIGVMQLARLLAKPRTVIVSVLLGAFLFHDYYTMRVGLTRVFERTLGGNPSFGRSNFEHLELSLRHIIGTDRSIYVFQEPPILYDDLGAEPPTRYLLSADLIEPNLRPMLGFSGKDELNRILERRPHYIIVGYADRARDDLDEVRAFERSVVYRYRSLGSINGVLIYQLAGLPPMRSR
ncbi:MAG TPA: glycosyltransferase family 39 protein [Candidatus Baltobacteraceae bacterium]|jgi:hypothetical protein|nr:glycosyltransferase family 39 protein [Candidatus Baltobacteraceae bacterium]